MVNKKLVITMLAVILLTFAGAGTASAQTVVANFGDARVYYYGDGHFGVESDYARQCFPLNFRETDGWIQIVCSSEVIKVAKNQVGSGVKKVVEAAFAPYLSPLGSYLAGELAGQVASWAASQGINYLCGK